MRVPLSWLREYARLPEPVDVTEVARRLTAAGLEVESLESVGHDLRGVVIAQVLSIEELTGLKKPIRYCRVAVSEAQLDASPDEASGVICGATNFAVGDRVALALPGAVLPGGFDIGARRTYDHVSEGMICSPGELAIGDDHTEILVLPPDAPLGADFVAYAHLGDEVLEIAVTPDRGYAVSVRGLARELASAYDVPFTDPASTALPDATLLGGPLDLIGPDVYPARIDDPTACDRFVLREVRGFSPKVRTPLWMRVRLARCGMRPVSLAVDVTNYLMLELGQPLHAFDRSKLTGEIVVRRARPKNPQEPGERLETLDHVVRSLDPEDILITDSSGPISMAGTMGGLSTEIDDASTDLVIEAAHFSARGTATMSRRHKLHTEASYRFERGVDRELPLRATAKAVALLAGLGGGRVVPGCTHAQADVAPVVIAMAVDYPDRVAGLVYGRDTVVRRLQEVGCTVVQTRAPSPTIAPWRVGPRPGEAAPDAPEASSAWASVLDVTPPSWRPDLTDPADLAEEVIRLEGYESVPSRMPRVLAGRGLTPRQRLRRSVGRTLAESGYVEVLSSPFASRSDADRLGLPPEDLRRPAVVVANPLSEDEPLLRTTLLPGLFRVLARNIGRGFVDTALFEIGLVFRPRPGAAPAAPILPVDRGPTVAELASLEAALPDQPQRIAAVLAGARELDGWWGPGRASSWADAIEAAREIGRICRVPFDVRAEKYAPWHPGRCAAIYVRVGSDEADGQQRDGQTPNGLPRTGQAREWLAGHAGELHPRVIEAFGLPDRTCAMELDLSVLFAAAESVGAVQAPQLSAYPLATQDVALIVDAAVPAADVEAALVAGAPADLLESVRLFDVYTGAQIGEDRKSLAYTLRFRAADRTLTAAETADARDAAVAEAQRRVGAVLRSG